MKEYAPACDRNQQVILDVLEQILTRSSFVLEIGSGTGQHAVYFADALGHLNWQPTNKDPLDSIHAWRDEANLENLLAPASLDLLDLHNSTVDTTKVDAIVCINTIHIMAWQGTENLFSLATNVLPVGGLIYVYGPYRYSDRPLEPSNENFDLWLKERDPVSGIRHFDEVNKLAQRGGLELGGDIAMPANNRSIWWRKS
jgi:cyclopropane fatty-acyl-phospholipid synthase-like methyltransferase